jgi:sodium-dependent dicarboxylate transporter 2/3/5
MTQQFRTLAFFLGPIVGLMVWGSMTLNSWDNVACLTAGLTTLCAIWWVFEPIPIPATSLIPLGVFPLLGILNGSQVAAAYGHPLILLLMGGAMLSKAMEKSGAHRRLALGMVRLFGGGKPRRLVLGFMVASAVLSMWISNTATTLMLLPVALAILEKAPDKKIALPLLLGIAYAASIGGLGTLIGTPPNVIFLENYRLVTGVEPTFMQWMGWALPVVVIFVPIAAMWLTRKLVKTSPISLLEQGLWRIEEIRVLVVFTITALAWATLKEPFGGWSRWFNLPTANYAAVALTAVVVMFVVPNGKGEKLLDWESACSIHWGVLLLFAGGIAIATAFGVTGLSSAIGERLAGLTNLPPLLMLICVTLGVTFLTEVTSNTATTTLLMPILGAAAIANQIEPALLMLPAALSASCAFMLPVATAPNAIVFGTGRVKVGEMIREGFALNIIGTVIITLVCYWLLV